MGEGLLRAQLAGMGVDATVRSAGTLAWGGSATTEAVAAVRERGIPIDGHESRALSASMIEESDLVLAMTRDHVARVVALVPHARDRTFLIGELVRLGSEVGSRSPDEPVRAWSARVSAMRPHDRVVGRGDDEVPDPMGEPLDVYRATAARLDRDLAVVARLLAGGG